MLELFQKAVLKVTKGKSASMSVRDTKLLLSISTAGLSKFIGLGSTLITIPITLNYLGPVQFGIWMVISGFIGFIGFSDLGIGMGLQNALSKAYGENDKASPKYLISSAYFTIFFAITIITILMLLLGNLFSTSKLFSLKPGENLQEATNALNYCLMAFIAGVPISLVGRILNGYQKNYITNNISLLGQIISLFSIFLSIWLDLGLVGLALLYIVSPLLALLGYSLYFFKINFDLVPRITRVNKIHIKAIMSSGLWTVFVKFIYAVKMSGPVIIISASLGAVAVAEYSIAQKLIGVGAMVISMALQPLWTVYGEAYYRGDKVWIEQTLAKSIKIVLLLTVVGGAIFVLFGLQVIEVWLGNSVLPSFLLIVFFSLWMIASSVNICFTMVLNGTDNFRNQSLFSVVFVSAALIIAYGLAPNYGSVSVILSMLLVAELCLIPFFYVETKKVISKIKSEHLRE
jgi:O-antigen/teichoic acid export membrane protein